MKTLSVLFSVLAILSLTFVSSSSKPQGERKVQVTEASVFNGAQTYSAESDTEVLNEAEAAKYVIPLGKPFGIKLFTDGIIVASLTSIETGEGMQCPAKDSGIRPGDYIVSVNGEKVDGNASLAEMIGESGGQPMKVQVRRDQEIFETSVTPVFSVDSFKTGMWIRDSAAGIGMLTFYNPDAGVFSGLGHGICDMDTSGIMQLDHGEPAAITLCGIIQGEKNAPGQLQGFFSSDEALGELLDNNETGIYGTLDIEVEGEPMEVAEQEALREGPAKILTTVNSEGPQYYDVEIKDINPKEQKTRNFVVRVTDEKLLALTGGIVQGMSGSPIIQDDKLVGAVTHVFTEDPTTGYGIYAVTMLKESVVSGMSKNESF